MQTWKQGAKYAPLAAIDEDDEVRLSNDSGSSLTLAGSPDVGGHHDAGPSKYPPPDSKKSFPSIYDTSAVRRPSRVAYVIIVLSGTVVILTLLLVVSISGSFTSSTSRESSDSVADLAQDLAEATSSEKNEHNITVNEALTRLQEEGWIPLDSTRSSPFVPSRRPLVPLASQKQTTYACAEQWIAKGELCSAITSKKGSLHDSEIDVAWTWVTANEHWTGWRERLSKGMHRLRWNRNKRKVGDAAKNAKERHFRSHHQMKYSQRSIMKNLPWVKKLHLLASDLPACDPKDVLCSNTHEDRIGQIPNWLDAKIATRSGSGFDLQFHWDLFKADDEDAGAWRARSLPTFDSLAIESQLPNLRGAAENFLYMNDDLYIIRPMSPADFATPLFGQVFRIQKDLGVGGEAPGTSKQKADGEWPGMTYSAWLLDRRFGIRSRGYLVHQGKMLSTPLLDEVASIWSEELKESAQVRFRGTSTEVNMLFLSTYYTIERHREALLWSYFIARMDSGRQGHYSAQDRAALGRELGISIQEGQLIVSRPHRPSYEGKPADTLLRAAHLTPAERTPYQFSSMNGYAFMPLGQPSSTWPDLDAGTVTPEKPWQVCNISLPLCFGTEDYFKPNYVGDVTSQTLFKRMTFDHPECGDCAIAALLSRSPVGLSPFLPASHGASASSPFDPKHSTTPPPLLGSWAKSWEATDFNIQAVLGDSGWNLREYVVRMLQRYSYVIGGTSTRFISLRRPLETVKDLKSLTESLDDPNGPSLIAMNDDILKSTYVPVVDANLAKWHEQMWPNATVFERVKSS